MNPACTECGEPFPAERYKLGYKTCLACGELSARQVKHTIAPLHKSNYMVITNQADLKGLNNKGGLIK